MKVAVLRGGGVIAPYVVDGFAEVDHQGWIISIIGNTGGMCNLDFFLP